ncbi:hypothetical protein SLEP1_g6847 [Rubroshorea leprosula]|uniref:Integrase catalytic domain-containing protein n=1 Tax=Rubroshorea leprosula TaxID=152421 RepID=A0AAV5I6C7_9ROSI|nr:hypothetical protein SLEP1_g6847 [Rubroshorea leprosula]
MEDLFHIQFYRSEPEVSMADLSRLVQRPEETSKAFLARFRKARLKCRVALPEQEFVKLAQNGLDIELRKKFEGMEFRDFFELSYKVARYENLLREDTQRKSTSHGTYYGDANFDLDVAEVVADKPVVCPDLVKVAQQTDRTDKIDKGILRFPDKAKETITQTYYKRRLAADDLRWVIEEARARRNQVRSSSYRRRQPGGHNSTQQKNNANQGTAISRRVEKPRMVKPPPRSLSKRWERVVHPKFPKGQNPRTLRRRLQRKKAIERHRQQITDSGGMADQAQPLPARRKSVWVHKEKGSTSGQNAPEKEEPPKSPTSPRVLAVESNEETGLKAKFDVSDKVKNSSDVICFGEFSVNLSCLVITLPLVFQAREQSESTVCHQTYLTKEEEVIKIPTKKDGGMDLADKIIFEKPEERMARHIRPLYIHAHLDGMPINRVLVDNGAAINVLPTCILHKIGKSLGDLMETEVTISDFTGGVNRSRGILPVELTVEIELSCVRSLWLTPLPLIMHCWGEIRYIPAVEAHYYDEDIGTIRFFGMDCYGRPSGITACTKSTMDRQTVKEKDRIKHKKKEAVEEIKRKLAAYLAEKQICVDRFEVIYEGEEEDLKDQITLEELDLAPAKLDDLKAEVQDPLEEVNLGTEADPKITFISGSLEPCLHDKIINILREYKDCFAWDYSEMPGLDRNLVEHKLPIREDFKPFKQPPRRMSPKVTLKVKEEIERLLKVGFIRTSRYVKWLSNVVPVVKKNGKLRICVDFINLNLTTPKDEYPMPIADLLVDGAARHRILSLMDGHSGYNQIFIAEEDIPNTTFRCPGAIAMLKVAKACQIHGPLQRVPASELHPIVKPWPFRGWAIDLIGKVYPPSTRGHSFIIVATNYFTKWVEAKPMKKIDQTDIIKFLKEEIIHRFGLPETVTSDQGTVFVGAQVEAFAKEMGFRLLTSTPHYAQANGQAEASNRIVINLLEKMVDDNPRCWHELLSDTIWAYKTSQRSSIKVTPFSLTYGHDAVLPMELSTRSLRIAIQHGLTSGEYNEAMILELEDLEGMRLTALDRLQT